jgi:hypothetical protein
LITEKKLGDGKVLFISNNKSFLATDTKRKLFLCFFKKKLFFFLPMAIYNIGLFMLEDILNTLLLLKEAHLQQKKEVRLLINTFLRL